MLRMRGKLLGFVTLISLVIFYPSLAFAVKLDKLTVGGHDATNLDYIEVHKEDLIEVKKKVWEKASKWSIPVEGSLFPSEGVSKVQYSLDGGYGFLRAQGEASFYFTFVPIDGATHPVVINFFDRREEVIFSKRINVYYTDIDWNIFFKDFIEQLRRAYEDGDLKAFLSFFHEEEYPYISEFEKYLYATFDENSAIRLSITVNSVEISSDTAIIEVDWRKTFDDDSLQSGQATSFSLKEKRGQWKILSVSDEEIFLIGKGTIHLIY